MFMGAMEAECDELVATTCGYLFTQDDCECLHAQLLTPCEKYYRDLAAERLGAALTHCGGTLGTSDDNNHWS